MQLVITIIRATGAMLMLGGVALGFDAGGAATAIGMGGPTAPYIGGALFMAGLADFFVVPIVLARSANKDK